MEKLIGYLKANEEGLADDRHWGLEGVQADQPDIGSMESSNDKLVCDRYKKRARAWSVAGADRLARRIELQHNDQQHNGRLSDWLQARSRFKPIDTATVRKALEAARAQWPEDPQARLQHRLPVLDGPACPLRDALAGLAGLRRSALKFADPEAETLSPRIP